MKTERERKLEAAIREYLEPIAPEDWTTEDYTLLKALADEDTGGGDMPESRRNWCGNCGREIGRHEKCPDWQPDATPPQQRDALEKMNNLEEVAKLINKANSLLPSHSCRKVRHALTNPTLPTVPEAVRRLPEKWRSEAKEFAAKVFAADELDRALAQSGEGRAGWKLVPVEPTERMLLEMAENPADGNVDQFHVAAYKAMLAAAPEPEE